MSVLRTNASVVLYVTDPLTLQEWTYPVASVSATFGVNEVPTCNLELGIGLGVNAPVDAAPIESAPAVLLPHRVCRVVVYLEGETTAVDSWPSEPVVMFEGNCIGVGTALTRGRASLSVTLRHWLAHLQSSTVLGGYAIPMDPDTANIVAAAFGFNNSGSEGLVGNGGKLASIKQLADGRQLFDSFYYLDMWAEGIKPLLANLMVQPLVGIGSVETCADLINTPSPEAIDALRRIEGRHSIDTVGSITDNPPSRWAVQLRLTGLDGESRLQAAVLQSIADAITSMPINYATVTDVWSQLVARYCADFGMMLVPRVNSAIMAPRVDALRSSYCYKILASDIAQIDTLEPRHRPLAYVGVVAKSESFSGYEGLLPPVEGVRNSANSFIGCYPYEVTARNGQDGRITSGLTRFVSPPKWLIDVPVAAADPNGDFRNRSPRGGVASAGTPADTASRQETKAAMGQAQELLMRYAKMRYNQSMLHGRIAKVVGKLRFDISPGSTVALSVQPEDIVGLQLTASEIVGFVDRLTIVLDAKQKLAMTVFQVTHIRSETENASDDYSSDTHPLYSTVFHGCPLIDDYALTPTSDTPCPQG